MVSSQLLEPKETNLTMALYGYARVSTSDQDFVLQEKTLREAGCDVVRAEKKAGLAGLVGRS